MKDEWVFAERVRDAKGNYRFRFKADNSAKESSPRAKDMVEVNGLDGGKRKYVDYRIEGILREILDD